MSKQGVCQICDNFYEISGKGMCDDCFEKHGNLNLFQLMELIENKRKETQ